MNNEKRCPTKSGTWAALMQTRFALLSSQLTEDTLDDKKSPSPHNLLADMKWKSYMLHLNPFLPFTLRFDLYYWLDLFHYTNLMHISVSCCFVIELQVRMRSYLLWKRRTKRQVWCNSRLHGKRKHSLLNFTSSTVVLLQMYVKGNCREMFNVW